MLLKLISIFINKSSSCCLFKKLMICYFWPFLQQQIIFTNFLHYLWSYICDNFLNVLLIFYFGHQFEKAEKIKLHLNILELHNGKLVLYYALFDIYFELSKSSRNCMLIRFLTHHWCCYNNSKENQRFGTKQDL